MSIVVTCSSCRRTLLAPDAAAGLRVKCRSCATILSVPALPDNVPIALEPVEDDAPVSLSLRPKSPEPAKPPVASAEPNVWLLRGLGIATFLVFCCFFGIIGAARNPDEPVLGASRMARTVGAPLALMVIAAVEIVVWLRRSARSTSSQESRVSDHRRRSP